MTTETPGNPTVKPDPEKRYRPFLLLLLFVSFLLTYRIIEPFLNAVILAIVIASLLYPLQEFLVRAYGGRKNLAASTVIAALVFLILIPLFFFFSAMVQQGVSSVRQLNDWISSGSLQKLMDSPRIQDLLEWINHQFEFLHLEQYVQFDQLKLQKSVLQIGKNLGQFVVSRGATLLSDMAGLITHFFIMIFVCYYLLRDGEEMIGTIKYLSPLRSAQENRILEKIREVNRSALLGSFMTAICQGLVGGIGFVIVGVPAIFWGTVMAFCSFIPVVGTALIWVPAVGYLLLLGQMKTAAFLSLWCIVLVGSIDNFLRPVFMKGKAEMSTFYIFLSILGGVQVFGLVGVLYGPLILGFAKVMLYIYQVEYQDLLEELEPQSPGQKDAEIRAGGDADTSAAG